MDWSNYYQAHKPYMATAIGSAHVRQGANCQDAVRYADGNQFTSSSMMKVTGRVIAGAVCDGVGSYGHSEVGAKLVSAAACTAARDATLNYRKATPAAVALAVEQAAAKAAMQVALMVGAGWEDFVHCTLLLLVCTPSWTGAWHCGDGTWTVNDAPLTHLADLASWPEPRTRDIDITIADAAGLGTLRDDLGVFAIRPIREGER